MHREFDLQSNDIEWIKLGRDYSEIIKKMGEYQPEIILAIAQGGFSLADMLASHFRGVEVIGIKIQRHGEERFIDCDPKLFKLFNERKVLLVEDCILTGLGPKKVKDLLLEYDAEVRVAAFRVSPACHFNFSGLVDFYGSITDDLSLPWKPDPGPRDWP